MLFSRVLEGRGLIALHNKTCFHNVSSLCMDECTDLHLSKNEIFLLVSHSTLNFKHSSTFDRRFTSKRSLCRILMDQIKIHFPPLWYEISDAITQNWKLSSNNKVQETSVIFNFTCNKLKNRHIFPFMPIVIISHIFTWRWRWQVVMACMHKKQYIYQSSTVKLKRYALLTISHYILLICHFKTWLIVCLDLLFYLI